MAGETASALIPKGRFAPLNRSGFNISDMRENNRMLALKYICTSNGVSRIELAKLTGLTKMTLTNITNELIQAGLICQEPVGETLSGSVGRKPIMLTIAPDSPVVAGVWISRDFCYGVLSDLKANVLAQKRIPLGRFDNAESLCEKLVRCVEYLTLQTPRRVIGVGICSLGPVDIDNGVILKPTNFYGITDVHVAAEISAKLGLPAFLEKDMNASALAEKYYGRCRDVSDFVYLGITNGIGAGVVSSGELFHGGSGFSGEFGHTSIDYCGELCHCGNRGCIELYASVPNILRNYYEQFGEDAASLNRLISLADTDEQAAGYLKGICERIATALVNISNVLDPSVIVIGHDGFYFSDKMLEIIEQKLNRDILASGYKRISLCRSAFADCSPLVGAATIVMDKIFTGRLNILA